jgi:hypothetical protein
VRRPDTTAAAEAEAVAPMERAPMERAPMERTRAERTRAERALMERALMERARALAGPARVPAAYSLDTKVDLPP